MKSACICFHQFIYPLPLNQSINVGENKEWKGKEGTMEKDVKMECKVGNFMRKVVKVLVKFLKISYWRLFEKLLKKLQNLEILLNFF